MCREVRVSAVIGFSLKKKRCVSGQRLLQLREKLLQESDFELLADISFSSIKRLVDLHPLSLSLRCARDTFGVCKKRGGDDDKLFDDAYHRKCYSSACTPKLYSVLNDILSDIK